MNSNNPEKGAMSPEKSRYYSEISETIFAPIYPVLASQILDRTGIRDGTGLDIGGGPGDLAIEVAKISTLRVYSFDISSDMFSIAWKKIREQGMINHVIPILGDVHRMKCPDGSIDLVFSRGSFFFWEDLKVAFSEVYRVLSPDGYAYIGAGFGSAALRDQIIPEMNLHDPDWKKGDQNRGSQCNPEMLTPILQKVGFREISFIQDDSGFWMILRK